MRRDLEGYADKEGIEVSMIRSALQTGIQTLTAYQDSLRGLNESPEAQVHHRAVCVGLIEECVVEAGL